MDERLQQLSGGACDPAPFHKTGMVYAIACDVDDHTYYYTGLATWMRETWLAKTYPNMNTIGVPFEAVKRMFPGARIVPMIGGAPCN